jgi:exodeoxyribonuclease VII large subunit
LDPREFAASRSRSEPAPASILTVSELVLRASNALEAEFGTVAVEGEISSLKRAGSGHLYWTLKDASSAVECVMYRSDNQRLRFGLADGARVVVVARPTIYRVRGRFQLTVVEVLPQGRGALYLRYEQLRERLAAEGLFDEARKRKLPRWPRVVGLVTSAEGAAVRDICTIIRRRAPATRMVLKPVPVQGREAAPEIARAIRWFARHRVAEVLIVGRGGGSLEDLWAFNEEIVVRAIAESPLPVVSAVGHETDTTLADFAADLRAPTPSAAAEAVVPETREIGRTVLQCFQRLARAVERQRVRRIEAALAPIRRYGFRRVCDRMRESRQRWGEASDALVPAVQRQQRRRIEERLAPLRRYGFRRVRDQARGARATLAQCTAALGPTVVGRIDADRVRLERARRIARETARRHERVKTRHAHLEERLHSLSPLAILDRGYAVVHGPDGGVVTDAARLIAGDPLAIRVASGRVAARVTEVEPGRPTPEEGR